VRIQCGSMFDGYEGRVLDHWREHGPVVVVIRIFDRDVPLEMEPSQVKRVSK